METEQGYYEQDKAGDERSLYGDMIRSRDFADRMPLDERPLYPTHQLNELGNYWKGQLDNPERSPRARKEIDLLLGRICFELVMRNVDHVTLSKRQAEEDAAWEEFEAQHENAGRD